MYKIANADQLMFYDLTSRRSFTFRAGLHTLLSFNYAPPCRYAR